jgi:trehalose 6-phosphate phosphatase
MQQLKNNETMQESDRSQEERLATTRNNVEQLFADHRPVALFLDIDGTLLDVALTPSTVHVPPGLAELLETLSARLSGAMAIITGRPIAEADELLQPWKFAAAGVHGGEMRATATAKVQSLTPSFNPDLHNDLKTIAGAMPGVVLEDKGAGIAMHYRLVPNLREPLLATLEALIPKYPGQFAICEGRKVVEILPVGFSKGRALRKLTSFPQFSGRIPIMIGDDISDIDAFRAAEALGGYGMKVAGENFPPSEASFSGPQDVLAWLKKQSEAL